MTLVDSLSQERITVGFPIQYKLKRNARACPTAAMNKNLYLRRPLRK